MDTIFALSSAPGRAGVAVIRVSGPAARIAANMMVGASSRPLEPRRSRLTPIRHPVTGALIDRGIAVLFPAPESFSGEDVVEFQVHGGLAVVNGILDALGKIEGLRLGEPGEFTRRAFGNGKLDLAQVEGLADLIDAETDAQRVQALTQSSGRLSDMYEAWRSRLIRARAGLEAAIDFSDEEDVAKASVVGVDDDIRELNSEIERHLEDRHRGEIVRDGFKIALAGPPNVGKSSLLNALARRDAAIVSAQAGTTRDVIEVRLDLGGYAVVVSDTAGLREGAVEIEREGIRRTKVKVSEADLVIWMIDLSAPCGPPPHEVMDRGDKVLVVLNKSDLVERVDTERLRQGWPPGARVWVDELDEPVVVSAASQDGIDRLSTRLSEIVSNRVGETRSPALTRARHRAHLSRCHRFLGEYCMDEGPAEIELRAELLRSASDAIGRITGRVDVEDVLDDVFAQFCIGK